MSFEVGTKVARVYSSHLDRSFRNISGPFIIAKVYKNGNFTLEGNTQQYRISARETAYATGDVAYSRSHLEPWGESIDAEIIEAKANRKRERRLELIRDHIKTVRTNDITDEQVAAIEVALGLPHSNGW